MAPKSLTILGATGSIGSSTLDLVARNPDRFRVEVVTCGSNAVALAALAREHQARLAVVADPSAYGALKAALEGSGIEAAAGTDAVTTSASRPVDMVVAAITGFAGLAPVLAAIAAGNTIALANKECLVAGGSLVMGAAARGGVTIMPVDSEHNAVFQALAGSRREDVETVWITASGGPFRTWPMEKISRATKADALKHPNWAMGPKVTIDSASLMNKGLELIEAHHLFALPPTQLKVLVHPQSVVHGMVGFRDGSVIAQLGPHDMRVPIAHALAHPERIDGPVNRLDLVALGQLSFEAPDLVRFPALRLAIEAMEAGGRATAVLNAANEVAVEAFLKDEIGFLGIAAIVDAVLSDLGAGPAAATLGELQAVDHDAREVARTHLLHHQARAM